jgi:hypothetical protein
MNIDNLLAKNKELKRIHAGRRCFLVGNGPSLNSQDVLLLRDEVKIVVNQFYLHPQIQQINPTYWVLADPLYWRSPQDQFLPFVRGVRDAGLSVKLFMPTGAHQLIAETPLGSQITPHFLHFDSKRGIHQEIDFSQPVPTYGQNVMSVALMLAFHLGCNPIYFMGCDHSNWAWTRDKIEHTHFHAEEKAPIGMGHKMSFDELQVTIKVQQFQYLQLLKYADQRGFRVFNATRGGELNLFPRIDFETLFSQPANGTAVQMADSGSPVLAMELGTAAVKLLNSGELAPALTLLDQAVAENVGHTTRVDGLDYVRAICLFRMGRHVQASTAARADWVHNPSNRKQSEALLQTLHENVAPAS